MHKYPPFFSSPETLSGLMPRQDIQEEKNMCTFLSLFFFFLNIIIFSAIFLSRHSTDRKEVHCAKTSVSEAVHFSEKRYVKHKIESYCICFVVL